MKTKPTNNKGLYLLAFAVIFGGWFFIRFNQTMNQVEADQRAEYPRYEAYFKAHNCNRRIETDKPLSNDMKPFLYCDNGVWSEADLVEVANGRVPKPSKE